MLQFSLHQFVISYRMKVLYYNSRSMASIDESLNYLIYLFFYTFLHFCRLSENKGTCQGSCGRDTWCFRL